MFDLKKKTHSEYIIELQNKNLTFEPIEEYIDAKTKIFHRCSICGYTWPITPNHILHGKGCPECAKVRKSYLQAKTHEQYVIEVGNIHPNIDVVDKYKNDKTKILHKCNICDCVWLAKPNDILKGCGCPECSQSHGEQSIQKWCESKNIKFITQYRFEDCRDKNTLPFDFYLPNYNTCIEYQGKQHYEPIEYFGGEENLLYTQYHDKIKYDYCIKNSINLICIPYWENINEYLNKNLLI